MPDHVHVLLRALASDAQPLKYFNRWRQWTGHRWRQIACGRLWQEGYWDYVLRSGDDMLGIAAYIAANPVRMRLAHAVGQYPWAGSTQFTNEQLLAAIQRRPDWFPSPTAGGPRL